MPNLKSLIAFLVFSSLIVIFLIVPRALAQSLFNGTMNNSNYILRMGNFNQSAGKGTNSQFTVTNTTGQTGPGLYTGTNYKVRSGFQYIYSIIPFSFTITGNFIDFGTLTASNPVTRTSTLKVNNQSAGGYVVTAYENHQLLLPGSGQVIPDTTCDNGTCTETTASPWTSSLVYGFGYRCDIVDATNYCVSAFSTSTNYKQFADNSKSETGQTIMSGQSSRNQRAQVTYKVNISGSQPAGLYTNVITYIATPTY